MIYTAIKNDLTQYFCLDFSVEISKHIYKFEIANRKILMSEFDGQNK